jgi:hypothetical protein
MKMSRIFCHRPMINLDDRVVIDGVPIGGHDILLIEFDIAGSLATA